MSTQESDDAITLTVEEKILERHRMSCDDGTEFADEEDMLGAQSLLFSSDSEEDISNGKTSKSPKKKISPKRANRVKESDDENNDVQSMETETQEKATAAEKLQQTDDDSEAKLNASPVTKKKPKKSRIIDSESEGESEQSAKTKKPTADEISKLVNSEDVEDCGSKTGKTSTRQHILQSGEENGSGDDKATVKEKPKRKKISALVDSDSEDESQIQEETKSPTKNNVFEFSDSESERNGHEIEANDKKGATHKRKSKHQSKIKKEKKEIGKTQRKTKGPPLADSDSESGSDEAEQNQENHHPMDSSDEEKTVGENKKKQKHIRASAQKAMDEMQAIQSEQQRLHREAHISVPYHKPKKYTLKEFLSRRTIIRPQQQQSEGSPAAAVVQSKSLKMTPEELEEYAKLMDERAKEATEFFKSESESEEEELKDNEGVLDAITTDKNEQHIAEPNVDKEVHVVREEPMEDDAEIQLNAAEMKIETAIEHNKPIDEVNANPMELDSMAAPAQIETNSEIDIDEETVEKPPPRTPLKEKIIITEVIELPLFDLNTLHINQDVPKPTKTITMPKIITAATPTITPTTTSHIKNNNTESLKKLITAKHLTESPTIKGDANMLIDLETGDLIAKKPSGVDNLLQRLIATNKHKKPKAIETVNILSTENGKLEMSKIQIHHLDAETDSNKEQKPGAAYFKLKENLKSIINNKRREDMLRKQEEDRQHNKCFDDDEEDYGEYEPETKIKNKDKEAEEELLDDEENELDINDDEEILEAENESDNENIPLDQNDDEVDGGADSDDEELENNQNDMDGDNLEDINEEEDTDDDENESNENGKRKNRIIKPFQDDSDDDDIDLLKTPVMPLYSAKTAELFNIGPKRNHLDDDEPNELLAFDITTQVSNTPLISQMPRTQYNNDHDNTDELLELCSGTFDDNEGDDLEGISGVTQTQATTTTQAKELPLEEAIENETSKCTKILSSDEENNERNEQQTTQRTKKLTKRIKKTKAKLGFSDDEDEEVESDQNVSGEEAEGSELDDEEIPETFVDYDSEENEIVVEMTKKDRRMKAENFVEKEAELSESDWGSADEDEKNLDRYDIELGDEDDFDREKLQAELGQIHARKMLDEDIREVRKIQEMFFEDEEQDGVGRQRQFKWKNAESGFSLDDAKREGEGDVDATQNGDSGDEESEHLWRKIRFEREQLLKEQRLKEDSLLMDATHTMSTTTSSTISTAGTVKKVNIITAKKSTTTTTATPSSLNAKKNSPFLISKCASTMHKKTVRGSFLVRDKEILNKLAGLTKGNNSNGINDHDTAGAVSVKDAKAKNFVFATLTEEEHETLKRKADDLMNSSNENGINYMKKQRVEPRREKCFIDQLL